MNPVDEEIEKIRAVRRKICDRFGNNRKRMIEYYRSVEQELQLVEPMRHKPAFWPTWLARR